MLLRCTDPGNPKYRVYGGRGITVDPRWKNYACFIADVGRRPSPTHQIDRIDNDGPYELWNVRWTTIEVQANNTSRAKPITFMGESLTLAQWSRRWGIPKRTLHRRLSDGLSLGQAYAALFQGRGAVTSVRHTKHLRQCPCGRKIVGNGYFSHRKFCRRAHQGIVDG